MNVFPRAVCCGLVLAIATGAFAQEEGDTRKGLYEWVGAGDQSARYVDSLFFLNQFDHSKTTSDCTQCHSVPSSVDSSEALNYWMSVDASGTPAMIKGVALGEYRIGNLNDRILRSHLKLKEQPALVVLKAKDVEEGSELKTGDVILKVDEQPVTDVVEFTKALTVEVDSKLHLHAIREGEEFIIEIAAAELATPQRSYRVGVRVEPPSAPLRSQLGLYENEGLLVTEVLKDSPAEKAELNLYDILLRASGERLSHRDDLRSVVQASKGNAMDLTIMRGGKEITLEIVPEQEPVTEKPLHAQIFCPALSTDGRHLFLEVQEYGQSVEAAAESDTETESSGVAEAAVDENDSSEK